MSTYEAHVTREGKFWPITVLEDGRRFGVTQARNVAEIEEMVRDLVATLNEVDASEVVVTVVFPDELTNVMTWYRKAQEDARAAQQAADECARQAAKTLVRSGLSVRDVAKLLGVSPSWVSLLNRKSA